jgi:hypothetical protein
MLELGMKRCLVPIFGWVVLGACAPANLRIIDVAPGDDIPRDVFVVEAEPKTVTAVVENSGGTTASPVLTFGELACMDITDSFADVVGDGVPPGEQREFNLTITATACSVQTIVDWFFTAEEGSSRGTFNVVMEKVE